MIEPAEEITKPITAWDVETRRFKELFKKWLDYHLNRFFDLSIKGPGFRQLRVLVLGGAFLVFGFIIHILVYSYLTLGPARQGNPQSLFIFAILAFFRLLFLLLIPAYIAIHMAGNYLADIFELKDVRVAWKFISELSLGGANEVLHIRDGRVAEEDKDSPILLIGGPGRVEVAFDSAVLFEKPDGTPHVIGPVNKKTEDESKKKSRKDKKAEKDNTILEGFERLRRPIINLRDQYVGNSAADAIMVESRSLDGIRISASDVRALFSIRRDGASAPQKPTKERPYLYNPQSVQDLIYGQSVQVLTQGPHPSGEPGQWTSTMFGLVSGAVSEFMNQNKLAEYLASISTPEIENLELREDTILWQTLQFSNQAPETTAENIARPTFHPRTELSARFMKYTEGFRKRAGERGVDLHWIGVGTWKMPDKESEEIINNQHFEAWHLSRENTARSDPQAIQTVMEEAELEEKLYLIQTVPFEAYQNIRAKYPQKEKAIEALLLAYRDQLGDALEIYYNAGSECKELDQIERAVLFIEKLLKITGRPHMLGGGSLSKVKRKPRPQVDENSPPAPSTHDAVAPYLRLLAVMTKLKIELKAIEPMLENEARRYPTFTQKELIENIVKRLERYGD